MAFEGYRSQSIYGPTGGRIASALERGAAGAGRSIGQGMIGAGETIYDAMKTKAGREFKKSERKETEAFKAAQSELERNAQLVRLGLQEAGALDRTIKRIEADKEISGKDMQMMIGYWQREKAALAKEAEERKRWLHRLPEGAVRPLWDDQAPGGQMPVDQTPGEQALAVAGVEMPVELAPGYQGPGWVAPEDRPDPVAQQAWQNWHMIQAGIDPSQFPSETPEDSAVKQAMSLRSAQAAGPGGSAAHLMPNPRTRMNPQQISTLDAQIARAEADRGRPLTSDERRKITDLVAGKFGLL